METFTGERSVTGRTLRLSDAHYTLVPIKIQMEHKERYKCKVATFCVAVGVRSEWLDREWVLRREELPTTLLLICDANGYFKYVVGRGWRCRVVKIMNRKCWQWREEWNTHETYYHSTRDAQWMYNAQRTAELRILHIFDSEQLENQH